MITMYTGTVGSGKSYHALELGLQWISRKRHVIANFPISTPKKTLFKSSKTKWDERSQRWHYWEEITPESLMSYALEMEWFGKESQCLVIIDEAGLLFNSRDWQSAKGSRTKWIKFLALSRKWGFDFIFVAQADRMIDKQIRGFVEFECKHLKGNNSFLFSWLSFTGLTLFMYVYRWYQTKLKANLRMTFYKPWIGNKYDTMKIFNQEDLIEGIEETYKDQLMPQSVKRQLDIWKNENELKERKKEEERQRLKDELENFEDIDDQSELEKEAL